MPNKAPFLCLFSLVYHNDPYMHTINLYFFFLLFYINIYNSWIYYAYTLQ
ncbi:hypothetical protein AB4K20DRAFT_1959172 [Rhizopus microsporus]